MATMIPHIAFDNWSDGELEVFEALQTLLPSSYTVLHSYRWVGSISGGQSQGEADFVIFHPQKGIIVLEVKAGIMTLEGRIWYQQNRNTGVKKSIRDPEEQASGSKFKLMNYISDSRSCLFCHAVWFPSVSFDRRQLPANYSQEILLDEQSLKDPLEAIDRVYSFWEKNIGFSTNLNQSQADLILRKLAPSLHLVPSMQLDYEKKEKQFVNLTHEQCRILDFLQMQKKATIAGAAGTGKTLIAIEKARQLHDNGGKVLFLCFNRLLGTAQKLIGILCLDYDNIE